MFDKDLQECNDMVDAKKSQYGKMYNAIRDGNLEKCREYFDGGFEPSHRYINLSILANSPDLVQLMIDHGCDLHRHLLRRPLLEIALSGGDVGIVEILLKNGADVNEKNYLKRAMWDEDRKPLVRLLIEYGADMTWCDSEGEKRWLEGTDMYEFALSAAREMEAKALNADMRSALSTQLMVATSKGTGRIF